MVMGEKLDILKELEQILSQKNLVEQSIQEIPKLLVSQEELLSRMKKNYIEKNEQYEKVRQHIVELKSELFEAESSRERSEKAMDVITTQREYEALDKEIKESTDKEQNIRKDLQKEQRFFQEFDEDLKKEEQLIQQQENELNERKASIAAEIDQKQKELKELEAKELAISSDIDAEEKFKLERIIKSKQDNAIVAIHGCVCTGCHMILPAQFANEVRIGDKIIYCPYCSRILYYVENLEGVSEFFNEEDAGSLSDLDDFSYDYDEDDDDEDDDDDSIDDDDVKMDYDE